MDFNQLDNSTVNIVVGDNTLQAKKLSLRDIYGTFEPIVINKCIERARQVSEGMSGSEKVEFMQGVYQNLPEGEELTDKAMTEMATYNGVITVIQKGVSKAGVEKTFEDIEEMISPDPEEVEKLSPLVEFLCGIRKNLEAPKKKGGTKTKKS